MIHSIIPMDVIFGDSNATLAPRQMMQYKGQSVEVSQTENGYKIERLMSTDPKSYLDPALQVGCFVNYSQKA
ncbi:MAG: YlzJ-like family protein [Hyphomonadaceae bacterium]|nr:YlzJ-like family protein [Clostridia bacterium]